MACAPRLALVAGAVALNMWSMPAGNAEVKPAPKAAAPAAATAVAPATAAQQPQPVDVWSPAEIAAGIAQCSQMLAGRDIVSTPVPAFRDGDCGAPAAVQLISVGRNPEVAINPPVTVTCEVASALAGWVKSELQPLAKAHLGAPIVRIDTMSSYSCRNAYGRKKSRLSEHGRANAIDIRAFISKSNEEAAVLADWGTNERRQAAIVAAAKAADARRIAAAAADAKSHALRKPVTTTTASLPAATAQPPSPAGFTGIPNPSAEPPARAHAGHSPAMALAGSDTGAPERDTSLPLPRLGTLIEGLPNIGQRIPTLSRPALNGSGFGEPSRLGGAKAQAAAPAQPPAVSRREQFLRAVHASACRTFGTTLGPEANAAHENHFHFDMAERHGGHFCE